MPQEDRAMDIGNMHKNFVEIARVIPGYPRGQTDTQTDISQYLAIK